MEGKETTTAAAALDQIPGMKLLFVEMGVGYDQHGSLYSFYFIFFLIVLILVMGSNFFIGSYFIIRQDITVAAMRACKDAISSNSIPAFRTGSNNFLF